MDRLDRIKKYLGIVLGDTYLDVTFDRNRVKIFCDAGFEVEMYIDEFSIKLLNHNTGKWE